MLNNLEAPSDAELISRVRGGDVDAYGQLFARHVESARRLARQLVRGPDSDDLVSDAFTKVMTALQSGGGPDIAFRAYLLTAVRRLHVDRIRAQSRLTTSDDLAEFDPGVPFQDTVVEQFESTAAARAFASLPERWQMVLWHLEVERQKPADVAPLLGMTPNSVSALAYRAREGLRQAFLAAHLADIDDAPDQAECSWVVEHLGSFVRKGLARRDAGKVQAHLDSCRPCTARYLELQEVNNDLSAVIAPLLLGGLAAGYLTATGSGIAVGGGVVALLDRAKDYAATHIVPVAAGTTAAGVAAAVVIVGGVGSGGRVVEPEAGAPPSRMSVRPAGPASDSPKVGPRQRGERSGPTGPATGEGGGDPTTGPDDGASQAPAPEPSPTESVEVPTDQPTDRPTSAPDGQRGPDRTVIKEPDPEPSPTEKPTQPPAGQDIAISMDGNYLSKGIGRFRTHVTNLPTGSGPTPLHLEIGFSDPSVSLERIPSGCSYAGSGVSCTGNGGTFNGLFDADMSGIDGGESVTITVTASLPGDAPDPDPGDNTASITLTRSKAAKLLAWD